MSLKLRGDFRLYILFTLSINVQLCPTILKLQLYPTILKLQFDSC